MQSENHTQNLSGREALDKVKELAEKIRTCFFNTSKTDTASSSRPMSILEASVDGKLSFMSHRDSNKNRQIAADSHTELYFSDPSGSHYLLVHGRAVISHDREEITRLWNPMLKIWFDGPEDPAITLLEVSAEHAFYWDTKTNKVVQLGKMLAGMITGKELDDSIEGRLEV